MTDMIEQPARDYLSAVDAVLRGPEFGPKLAALEARSAAAAGDEAEFRRAGAEIGELLDEVFGIVDPAWVAAGHPQPLHGGRRG